MPTIAEIRPSPKIVQHDLTFPQTPTTETLQDWWSAMWTDVATQPYTFSDTMSRDLDTFLAGEVQVILISLEQDLVASFWLHDLHQETDGSMSAWGAAWVVPDYRGLLGTAAVRLALTYFAARGLRHLFTAVHISNSASKAFTFGKAAMAFHRVMVARNFLPYGGVMSHCVISSWKVEDVGLARDAVARRAAQLSTAPGAP